MIARRSFLKSFIGVVASVALAQRVMLDSLWIAPVPIGEQEPKVNPAWVNALYEQTFVFHGNITKEEKEKITGKHPVRYVLQAGKFVEIPRLLT